MQENIFNKLAKVTETITLYTDGSCIGNPGPGGWAAIILLPGEDKPAAILKGRDPATTNNRMEMTAVIEGLRYIHTNYKHAHVQIFCDSNLIVQTINNGWKRKMNKDLWTEIDNLNNQLIVEYTWVKGHADNYWNNYCDRIAITEAEKARIG